MATVITLVGVPGSGKSTLAKRLKLPIVSTDAIREELYGDASVQTGGDKVFELAYKRVQDYLDQGINVIFDAMSAKRKYRKDIIDRFNARHVCIFLNTPLEECLRRNANRDRHVPEEVISKNYEILMNCMPEISEGYEEVVEYEGDIDEKDIGYIISII